MAELTNLEKRRILAEFAGYNVTASPLTVPGMPQVMLTDSLLPVIDDGVCQAIPEFERDPAAACSLLWKLIQITCDLPPRRRVKSPGWPVVRLDKVWEFSKIMLPLWDGDGQGFCDLIFEAVQKVREEK